MFHRHDVNASHSRPDHYSRAKIVYCLGLLQPEYASLVKTLTLVLFHCRISDHFSSFACLDIDMRCAASVVQLAIWAIPRASAPEL